MNNILTVPNHHIPMCGSPPDLIAKDCYTGYFENGYGEQLVFQYNRKTQTGTLWHGDWSWEQPQKVENGNVFGFILGEEEKQWISLVWSVAKNHI